MRSPQLANMLVLYASTNSFSAISLMSAPAANALSLPVTMIAPMLSSASNAWAAPFSSSISGLQSALSACRAVPGEVSGHYTAYLQ